MELDIRNGTEREIICVSNHPNMHDKKCYILTVGETYTLTDVEIHDWHTLVTLREFPDMKFNSVLFEEVKFGEENDFTDPYIHPCCLCEGEVNVWEDDNSVNAECGCNNCQIIAYETLDYPRNFDFEKDKLRAISRWNRLCFELERKR